VHWIAIPLRCMATRDRHVSQYNTWRISLTETDEGKNDSLNSEIEQFAESLPYWAKYLSSKLLSGTTISDTDIDTAYTYVLEDAGLKPSTEKPAIVICCTKHHAMISKMTFC
jgi:hypothetical protein